MTYNKSTALYFIVICVNCRADTLLPIFIYFWIIIHLICICRSCFDVDGIVRSACPRGQAEYQVCGNTEIRLIRWSSVLWSLEDLGQPLGTGTGTFIKSKQNHFHQTHNKEWKRDWLNIYIWPQLKLNSKFKFGDEDEGLGGIGMVGEWTLKKIMNGKFFESFWGGKRRRSWVRIRISMDV